MKRKKKSTIKKHFVRFKPLYAVLLIEVLIVLLFIQILYKSRPISTISLEKTVIVAEDICYDRGISGYHISVFCNSEEYIFPSLGFHSSYPNGKLYQEIELGDKIFITYYQERTVFGYKKFIVDAYTESLVLRTIEEYENGTKGIQIFETISFVIIEILYFAISTVYLWANNLLTIKKKRK